MNIDRPNRFRLCIAGAFGLSLSVLGSGCSSNAKTRLDSSGGTTAVATGGSTGQGGITAVGGTMTSGGISAFGTGGATGSGGSQNACPSSCRLLCPGVACLCDCSNSGGAGGSSTATGGNGGTTGTGGASSSGGGVSCYDSSGAIATTAKACALASDCKQVTRPGCCGNSQVMGLAKSSSCTFPAPSCPPIPCIGPAYQQADDGKTTQQDGTIGLKCASGQCKTFVTPGGADAGADAGPCPAGQIWCPGCTPETGICSTGGCPGFACPPPDAGTSDAPSETCSQVTTQAACDSRSDCHSVFVDPNNCSCAPAGCCARFSRCADGGHATCSGPPCVAPQPFCGTPYVLSYTGNCYEGCVLQSECAGADAGVTPPACPLKPPTNASSCGSTNMTCFYDNCPGTGRTQANCAGGTWTVQTAACGKVSCNGPSLLTCPSGQVCLITEAGTVGAQCVDNACGQGPVTSQCGTSLSLCTVNATLTSGVTITCNTCPQGGCA